MYLGNAGAHQASTHYGDALDGLGHLAKALGDLLASALPEKDGNKSCTRMRCSLARRMVWCKGWCKALKYAAKKDNRLGILLTFRLACLRQLAEVDSLAPQTSLEPFVQTYSNKDIYSD
jgi:hypothetical protein